MGSKVETSAGAGNPKMRESTGGAYEARGAFYIRVTVGPQKRQAERAPWATSLEAATERAKLVQGWVTRLRRAGQTDFVAKVVELAATADPEKLAGLAQKVDAIAGNAFERVEEPTQAGTFRDFGERWTSGELHRLHPDHIDEKASVQDDEERLEKYVYPHVGDVPLRSFTRAHADLVLTKLPPALKPATRRHVAQLVNRIVRLAQFTGIIDRSPLPPGWVPSVPSADSLAKESLLPSEEKRLLCGRNAAGEVAVPLEFRVLYAFLHREGMRKGEAKALAWANVNRGNGVVALDENKTDRPRSWVLQPATRRMLEAWHLLQSEPKAGLVFNAIGAPSWARLALLYRDHCQAAGIDRARLFERKANKLQLRAHDMRAFFVTAGMFAGHDAMWITDRTGHTSLGMLRRYERDVRRWRELGEIPVDADREIPEIAAVFAAANAAANADDSKLHHGVSHWKNSNKAEVAEWQTQRIQNPPSVRA